MPGLRSTNPTALLAWRESLPRPPTSSERMRRPQVGCVLPTVHWVVKSRSMKSEPIRVTDLSKRCCTQSLMECIADAGLETLRQQISGNRIFRHGRHVRCPQVERERQPHHLHGNLSCSGSG